jgi:hypothetical protein
MMTLLLRGSRHIFVWLAAACVTTGALTVACDKDEPKPAEPPKTAPSVPKAPKKELPWYQGQWSGPFTAKPFRVEMSAKEGAIKEWEKDDGADFAGEGQLELSVDPSGNVSGKASGPLGSLLASGEVDGDKLRVGLRPHEPASANQIGTGTLILDRKGDKLEGTLRTSTGDSHKLRVASLTLSREASPRGEGVTPPVVK